MVHVILLVVCAAAIYVSCEWFVNAVEWLGARLRIGRLAVGTILAAVGTALPESVVTLVAVLFGSGHGDEIGVGAAMGGPLVVGTLAYGVTAVALLLVGRRVAAQRDLTRDQPLEAHRSVMAGAGATGRSPADPVSDPAPRTDRDVAVDVDTLARDQTWFLVVFAVKVGLGLVAFAFKPALGIAFLLVYAAYVWGQLRREGEVASTEGLEPLKLQRRRTDPSTVAVVVQLTGALAVVFAASQLFVRQLEWAGPALGLPAVVVALLLSPVATELPEILNAVIWVRQGKADLALANISGSMMVQATVPSAIGLLLTPWSFDAPLILAGVVTFCSILYLRLLLGRGRIGPVGLLGAGGFYLAFVVGLLLV